MRVKIKKRKLKDEFPIEVKGLRTFEDVKSLTIYCNVSRSVVQNTYKDYPNNWIEVLLSKDTGPYYLEDVEYPNKKSIADKLGLSVATLMDRSSNQGYACIQDYLDYIVENKITYNGKVIYNATQLSKETSLDVMTASGIFKELNKISNIDDREKKLEELVNNKRDIILAIKRIDNGIKNPTQFSKKYKITNHNMKLIEKLNISIDEKVNRLISIITKGSTLPE